MSYPTKNKYLFAILVLLIIPISGLTIDIYVPSLPAITHYFNVDKSFAQLSITTYMVGLGIMQLFAGSISDSFGRKKPFTFAMLIFIIATLFVPFSKTIYHLLFFRFVQGITVALTVVPMRSVIFDLFKERELLKMTNYMTMAWSIGPIIAPAIGGYLQHYFGWQASFYFLAIYSASILSLALYYLPETSINRHPFKLKIILSHSQEILLHRLFVAGLFIDGILYSFIILFSIVGPFMIQSVLHYSAIQFGHIALLMGLAWFLGTMTNRLLIDVPIRKKEKICYTMMLIIVMIMLISGMHFPLNIYNIVIPVFLLLWLGGIMFPNYFVRSIALFPQVSGSANAFFGGFVFFIASISSVFGTGLKSTSELPLATAYLFLIISCIIISHFSSTGVNKLL